MYATWKTKIDDFRLDHPKWFFWLSCGAAFVLGGFLL